MNVEGGSIQLPPPSYSPYSPSLTGTAKNNFEINGPVLLGISFKRSQPVQGVCPLNNKQNSSSYRQPLECISYAAELGHFILDVIREKICDGKIFLLSPAQLIGNPLMEHRLWIG